MSWIDDLNEELEEQRSNYRKSIEEGIVRERIFKTQLQERRNSALESLKNKDPEVRFDELSRGGKSGGKKGGKNQPTEVKSQNAYKMNQTLNETGKRDSMAETAKKTFSLKREEHYKYVYDCIEFLDWFTIEDAFEKYPIKSRRHDGYITLKMLKGILCDSDLFEKKIIKIPGARKKIFKKKPA